MASARWRRAPDGPPALRRAGPDRPAAVAPGSGCPASGSGCRCRRPLALARPHTRASRMYYSVTESFATGHMSTGNLDQVAASGQHVRVHGCRHSRRPAARSSDSRPGLPAGAGAAGVRDRPHEAGARKHLRQGPAPVHAAPWPARRGTLPRLDLPGERHFHRCSPLTALTRRDPEALPVPGRHPGPGRSAKKRQPATPGTRISPGRDTAVSVVQALFRDCSCSCY